MTARSRAVVVAVPLLFLGVGSPSAFADDMGPAPAPGPGPTSSSPEWYPPLLLPPEAAAANEIPFQLFDPAPEDVVITHPPVEQVPVVIPEPPLEPFTIQIIDENGVPLSPEALRELMNRSPAEIAPGGYDVSGSPG
jgi:hypothetical protein